MPPSKALEHVNAKFLLVFYIVCFIFDLVASYLAFQTYKEFKGIMQDHLDE